MAVSRLKLANAQSLVEYEYHYYQDQFMQARRLRVCPAGHQWQISGEQLTCPDCAAAGKRAYKRFLLRAGRRGGKTRIGALAAIEESALPNTVGWVCAPTFPELEDYVMPAFFSQIPQAWLDHPLTDWSETQRTLMLPNRSIVQFRSLEDPDRGRGQGLNWLWIDEICKLTEKHWEVILPSLADRAGILIATTTPKGEDWVHERLFVPAESGRKGYWACVYRTIDNPLFASREELRAEIDEARATMTPEMFRQEFEAEIVTFTGAIFGAQVERGVIEGTEEEMQAYIPEWPNISADRPAITGLDPGADHPFAGVHIVQTPKGLVAVGEYAERARPFLLHAQGIALMRKGSTSRVMIDRSQAQAQVELAQYGLFTVPADNDVIAGINRISAWLAANKLDQGKLPVGGLILPRSCVPTLIRQLRKYRWAETDKKDGSKGRELVYKKDDDEVDALRYGLMGYPVLPKAHPEAAGVGKRDLSALPEQIRAEIERERKSMGKEAAKAHPDDGAGVVEDWEGSMGDFTLY